MLSHWSRLPASGPCNSAWWACALVQYLLWLAPCSTEKFRGCFFDSVVPNIPEQRSISTDSGLRLKCMHACGRRQGRHSHDVEASAVACSGSEASTAAMADCWRGTRDPPHVLSGRQARQCKDPQRRGRCSGRWKDWARRVLGSQARHP